MTCLKRICYRLFPYFNRSITTAAHRSAPKAITSSIHRFFCCFIQQRALCKFPGGLMSKKHLFRLILASALHRQIHPTLEAHLAPMRYRPLQCLERHATLERECYVGHLRFFHVPTSCAGCIGRHVCCNISCCLSYWSLHLSFNDGVCLATDFFCAKTNDSTRGESSRTEL